MGAVEEVKEAVGAVGAVEEAEEAVGLRALFWPSRGHLFGLTANASSRTSASSAERSTKGSSSDWRASYMTPSRQRLLLLLLRQLLQQFLSRLPSNLVSRLLPSCLLLSRLLPSRLLPLRWTRMRPRWDRGKASLYCFCFFP